MAEGGGLGRGLADEGAGGILAAAVAAVEALALGLDDRAAEGVNLVVELGVVGDELELVDIAAVAAVELGLGPDGVGYAGVAEGGLLRRGLADIAAAGGGGAGDGAGGVVLALGLHDLAGEGVDVVLILGGRGVEVYLVDHAAVLGVELNLLGAEAVHVEARVLAGGLEGGVGADVRARAGGAGLGDAAVGDAAGGGDEGDVVDGEAGEALNREGGIGLDELADELGLALGDVIAGGEGAELGVGRDGLADYRALEAAGAEGGLNHAGDALLQRGGAPGVAVGDGDEDGVPEVVEVAVGEHGANEGVHGHVELAAGEVHAAEHHAGVGVEGLDGGDGIAGVDVELDAGVDVEGYDAAEQGGGGAVGDGGVNGGGIRAAVADSVAHCAAEDGEHERGGYGDGDESVLLPRGFVHIDNLSFQFFGFQPRQHAVEIIGRAAAERGVDALKEFTFVIHFFLLPAMPSSF